MTIRTLLVDDEPLARQRLRQLVGGEPDLTVVGECVDGPDACAAIARERPDLVFLDVQMPEMDGFAVLQQVPRDQLPMVIFTTAFDRHAVRAFDAHALDYLLKPLKPERFTAAVARARDQLASQRERAATRGLLELLAERQATAPRVTSAPTLTRLTVKTGDKVVVVATHDIDSIEAAGNYVAVRVGPDSHILRETLTALEAQLDPESFLRISRSAIVNLARITELHPMFKGEHILVLKNGRRLTMTRGLRDVEQRLRFT